MAVRQLPPWVGQSRGTAIGSIALLDPVVHDDGGSFLERIGDKLLNFGGEGADAVFGFMLVLGVLVALSGIGASITPAFGAVLVLSALGWIFLCGIAWHFVRTLGEDAPPWARTLAAVLTIFGKIAKVMAIVATVIIILYLVLAILVAGREG